jgi:prepilin-type N-terminal cleavage/methylation domain-containing protein
MRRRSGFSLIEALVALAVAAMALLAIFSLQQQLAEGERRHTRTLELVALQRNALALTQDLNPTAEPRGSLRLAGGQTMSWTTEPRTAPHTNVGLPVGEGAFEVRLYRVRVDITDARGARLGGLDFDRVGWRRLTPAPAG